ncbi:hypothetical protein FF2_013163 [Malus domestica]
MYFPFSTFLEASVKPSDSFVWRSLYSSCEVVTRARDGELALALGSKSRRIDGSHFYHPFSSYPLDPQTTTTSLSVNSLMHKGNVRDLMS